MLDKFQLLRQVSEQVSAEQRAFAVDAENGIYVQFESAPGYDLKFESLESRASDIELLSVHQQDHKTLATVFIPDGKLEIFTNKIEKYIEEETEKGKPKNQPLIESISDIRRAALEALWTDDSTELPDDDEIIWWEVWLRAGDDPQRFLDFFREHARRLQLEVSTKEIRFPDRTVVTARGTKTQMGRSVKLLSCIAELRKAKETADFFTRMPPKEQFEWLEPVLANLVLPPRESPAVCILDTGINNGHPLLQPLLADADRHAYDPGWGVHDHHSHGTEMAGLSLYGDLTEVLGAAGPVVVTHRLESVKILPPGSANNPHLYGAITAESIARTEIQAPDRQRVVCMAVTATDDRDRGKPSSWSAEVDALCAGANDDTQRLIILSAGNIERDVCRYYPDSNMSDFGIHDPGQAWNAITVGACTEKTDLDLHEFPGWNLIAPAGDLSPSSSTSLTWQRPWPIKPDIVMEGGNMALNPDAGTADVVDSLQLLTTHWRPQEKSFVTTGDTSAASALAARMAATIQAQYPAFWPETIRAMIIHAAEWTAAMKARFRLRTKQDYENLLRYCGYGVPSLSRALWSARNCLTLIAQDTLQPFDKKESRGITQDLNLHAVPWPVEILQELGEMPVEMRVTLSYFIEPNPARRGWGRKYSYRSHGLCFEVRRPTETLADFQARINRLARDEEMGRRMAAPQDADWVLGSQLRKLGSVHSDTWRGKAVDLAARGYIAVYPVIGWWRENLRHKRWSKQARYALVITIKTPEQEIDLYTPVENLIRPQVAVQV